MLREEIQSLRGAAAGTGTLERASEVLQDWRVTARCGATAGSISRQSVTEASGEEHVSEFCKAIDNDVPIVLGLNILYLTRPTFGRPIDVAGTHTVRTRMPMIIIVSGDATFQCFALCVVPV
jgi:hypothetical protein